MSLLEWLAPKCPHCGRRSLRGEGERCTLCWRHPEYEYEGTDEDSV